ncbi:phosphatidylserine decarboxylase [Gammaproteobacteria bacterium]|nr:phosphatidylserine decarboxylase [Gammaproteobacteria bacterium]
MQGQSINIWLLRRLAQVQVPVISSLLVLLYATYTQAKWYGYQIRDFKSVMAFMLRRADLRSALKKTTLSEQVCMPIDAVVRFSGLLTHDLVAPVKGAGFNVAQLIGQTMPELTSGLVLEVCQRSAQHLYAPCHMRVERSFLLQHPIEMGDQPPKVLAKLYQGKRRRVIIASTSQGEKVVMVLIGSRVFEDSICPGLEQDEKLPLELEKGASIGYFIQGSAVIILGSQRVWSQVELHQQYEVLTDF